MTDYKDLTQRVKDILTCFKRQDKKELSIEYLATQLKVSNMTIQSTATSKKYKTDLQLWQYHNKDKSNITSETDNTIKLASIELTDKTFNDVKQDNETFKID